MPPGFDRRYLAIVLPLIACDGSPSSPPRPVDRSAMSMARPAPVRSTISTPLRRDELAVDEGRVEIEIAPHTSVGVPITAWVRIFPGAGYHINTDYPASFALTDLPGVTVERTQQSPDESQLAVKLAITPGVAGAHVLHGKLSFGICRDDRCLSRAAPITLNIDAS